MKIKTKLPTWQQKNADLLLVYLQQQRIPQALLLIGEDGLGIQQLAEYFIANLLCQNPKEKGGFCEQCTNCRLLIADTHPDIQTITPTENKNSISVEQIRQLIDQLQLKPQFEGYRVIIINPADKLNINSANAFLKYLEEPTERTLLILITDNPSNLPATITSRCQRITLLKPDEETACNWLQIQQPQLEAETIKILVRLAQNAPYLALSFAKDNTLALRNECFNNWQALAKHQIHPLTVAETWQKLPETNLLFWISSWLTDIVKCHFNVKAEDLYNPDLYKSLHQLSKNIEPKKVFLLYDLLLNNKLLIQKNINKQLMFEELLIKWVNLNQKAQTL